MTTPGLIKGRDKTRLRALSVLAAIAHCSRLHAQYRTSRPDLAKKTGSTDKQIRTALRKLAEAQLIEIDSAPRRGSLVTLRFQTQTLPKPAFKALPDKIRPPKKEEIKQQPPKKIKMPERKKAHNDSPALRKQFEEFRESYPGPKRGGKTEYDALKKHHDYREVIPLLGPALTRQREWRKNAEKNGSFVPTWQHLKTWLHQRSWELEQKEVIPDDGGPDPLNPIYQPIKPYHKDQSNATTPE